MINVLLTGASGRIGRHLTPAFQEVYALRTFDRCPVPGDQNSVIGELQDFDAVKKALTGCEVVVHLAAYPTEGDFHEQLVPANLAGCYNVFEAARQAGVRRIVFASTVETVGSYPAEVRVEPDHPPRPSSIYGATKVFGEALGRFFHDRHGMEFIAIRIGAFEEYAIAPVRSQLVQRIWLSPRDAVSAFSPGGGTARHRICRCLWNIGHFF